MVAMPVSLKSLPRDEADPVFLDLGPCLVEGRTDILGEVSGRRLGISAELRKDCGRDGCEVPTVMLWVTVLYPE